MTLFADQRNDAPRSTGRRSVRRSRIGWTALSIAIVGTVGLSLVPSPYVIEQPGPVFDTLGEVTVGDELVPLISIPGEETYPTGGTLQMLTVSVVGNRDSRPNWFEVITAWGNPAKAVVPLDAIFPVGQTVEQSQEQSAIDMANSQKDAIAASLTELGYTLDSTLTVAALSPDSPSEGVIEEGDQIVTVDGETPIDVTQLRGIIADNGTESPVTIDLLRDGEPITVEVTPVENTQGDGDPIVGIGVSTDYTFPFDVKIQLEKVGGPSAGLMFALGIIDKLSPGELNGGEAVAGTGTISADGTVGPIGGIRQKLYGARDQGAEYFFAPEANCDEVVGHVPDGLTVFSVATMDEALTALEAVADGGDTSVLPSCST